MSVVEAASAPDAVAANVNSRTHHCPRERVVATVLFTDIVGSVRRAWDLGDRAWCDLLEAHDDLVRAELDRHGGREIDTAGDGFFATFTSPGSAIACACGIGDGVRSLGLETRAGLHIGELERLRFKVGGVAVLIGARIAGHARASEVLVSRTLKELLAGSDIGFCDRGSHALRGLPGRWPLFAVERRATSSSRQARDATTP
ncbi:MAG TPA: adenylate/guanylate cyclase domain-containing protein [Gaiellaceae bacterium]|nr:adenylate/guanylate cyclase domain-containing protein [Gaiellaceae bacterium]